MFLIMKLLLSRLLLLLIPIGLVSSLCIAITPSLAIAATPEAVEFTVASLGGTFKSLEAAEEAMRGQPITTVGGQVSMYEKLQFSHLANRSSRRYRVPPVPASLSAWQYRAQLQTTSEWYGSEQQAAQKLYEWTTKTVPTLIVLSMCTHQVTGTPYTPISPLGQSMSCTGRERRGTHRLHHRG